MGLKKPIIFFILMLCSTAKLLACVCEQMDKTYWYYNSDLIIKATATEIIEADSSSYAVYTVSKIYKGNLSADTLQVHRYFIRTSCQPSFKLGVETILFLGLYKGKHHLGPCSPKEYNTEINQKDFLETERIVDLLSKHFTLYTFTWRLREVHVKPKPLELQEVLPLFDKGTGGSMKEDRAWAFLLYNLDTLGNATAINLYEGRMYGLTSWTFFDRYERLNLPRAVPNSYHAEALRIGRMLTKWTPAIMNGKKVNSQVVLRFEYYEEEDKLITDLL